MVFPGSLRGKETPGDAFIEELAKRLRFAKLDPEGRRIHMYNWLYESTKIENAKKETRAQAATSKALIAGLPLETIANVIASSLKAAKA